MNALESLAPEALAWLWRASWQSALLVLVVLGLQRVLGQRLSPRWRYGLWWIVVARLMLPPLVLPDFAWPEEPAAVESETAVATAETNRLQQTFASALRGEPGPIRFAPTPVPMPTSASHEAAPVPLPPVKETAAAEPSRPVDATPPESGPAWPSPAVFFLLSWLAGALGFAGWSLVREAALRRRLRGEPLVTDPAVLDLVERCKREVGIRRAIRVIRTSSVSSPALFGFLRPRLLLPESTLAGLSPDQLGDVIRHELEHLRHHDVAWNWLLQALVCLHWMNPFVWLAATRLRTDRETVRDLGVLDREPARTGRDYGRTILRVVESSARFRARALLVGILEDRSDVKRRIAMIARYDGNSRRGLLLGGLLTCALALMATVAAGEPPEAATKTDPEAKKEAPEKKAPKPIRPWILVTGYQADGDLFKQESRLDHAMEVVTEAVLTDRFQTVSYGMLKSACDRYGREIRELAGDPDLRLSVAKDLNVAFCISGWAVSFGERVVLVIEIIDPVKGLPGKVHRAQCDGVKGIPDAIEKVLGVDGVIDAQQIAAARKRQANGPRDLRPVYAKIPRDDLLETYPNDAYRKLEAMIMAEKTHGTAAELAEAKRCLAEAIAHLERLRKDEAYRNEYVVRMNVRLHPVYSRLDYEVVSRPPYLLFVEKSGKRSENTVARYANTLTRLYEEFHRHLGKPLGLAPLETCAQPADRALKVFVFTNTEAFRRHQRHLHVALPPGVTSYYSARDRWIVLDAGEAPRRGMEDFPLRRLVHEGTHQLMHAYSKVTREKASGKAMEWEDVRYSKQLWLQEGPAELLAGAMRTDDEPWSLATPLWHRVAELIATRAADKSEFTLDEIFGMTGTLDLMRAVRTKSLDPSEHGRLSSLAYAQFWATTHHLWNFADGTYRDRLVAALRQELRGNSGPMIWVATWGGEGPVDWSGLEGEIRASVAAMGR